MSKDIDAVIEGVLHAASVKRENAGHDGRMDDGGAARLEEQVKFYRAGQQGTIPLEWRAYTHILDPEWDTYLRLKAKFGGVE